MTISILFAAIDNSIAFALIAGALVVGTLLGFALGGGKAKRDVNAQLQEAEKRGVERGIEQRKATAEAAIGSAEQEAERIRSSANRATSLRRFANGRE